MLWGMASLSIKECWGLVVQPRVASAEVITGYSEASFSPYVKAESVILHPGEVSAQETLQQRPSLQHATFAVTVMLYGTVAEGCEPSR